MLNPKTTLLTKDMNSALDFATDAGDGGLLASGCFSNLLSWRNGVWNLEEEAPI